MLTPSIPRTWKVSVGVLYVLFFLYAVVVMQQILLGLLLPAFLIALVYVGWRVWRLFRMHERKLEAETEELETTSPEDPVETLKQRYAAGELTEEELEAQLEELLEAGEHAPPTAERNSPSERTTGVETERTDGKN